MNSFTVRRIGLLIALVSAGLAAVPALAASPPTARWPRRPLPVPTGSVPAPARATSPRAVTSLATPDTFVANKTSGDTEAYLQVIRWLLRRAGSTLPRRTDDFPARR